MTDPRRSSLRPETSSHQRDEVIPGARWVFDEEVTQAFDDMLERSVPQHDVMRDAVHDIAVVFLEAQAMHAQGPPLVVDLGCSRGQTMAMLVETLHARQLEARFVGLDASGPMVQAARSRFVDDPHVEILQLDLRERYPPVAPACVTLAILTLQFVPIEYRQSVVKQVYEHTATGGCFILVEKVLGQTAQLNDTMVARYLDVKRANGYSEEQIIRKRLALEGVLVPITASWNEELLTRAGFEAVDCIWRWMNFAAWVAIRTT